jgi:hypothetical protein
MHKTFLGAHTHRKHQPQIQHAKCVRLTSASPEGIFVVKDGKGVCPSSITSIPSITSITAFQGIQGIQSLLRFRVFLCSVQKQSICKMSKCQCMDSLLRNDR